MAQLVKQSTVTIVRIGPFVDVGDGFTPETGVTVAASDEAEVLKAAGAATVSMAGTFAAITGADGWYDYTLSATDTDVVGDLTIVMNDDDVYLPTACRFQVIEEEVFDDIFATSSVGYLKPTTAGRDLNVSAGNAVVLVDTCTTNTDVRGTDSALLASSAPTNFVDLAITATTGRVDVGNWIGTTVTLGAGAPDVNIQSTDNIALGAQQKTDVNAEVVDVLKTDTIAELTAAIPSATPTFENALMLLYMALRNKLDTTSTQLSINNDAGSVIIKATLSDDGTTFSRAELEAGP